MQAMDVTDRAAAIRALRKTVRERLQQSPVWLDRDTSQIIYLELAAVPPRAFRLVRFSRDDLASADEAGEGTLVVPGETFLAAILRVDRHVNPWEIRAGEDRVRFAPQAGGLIGALKTGFDPAFRRLLGCDAREIRALAAQLKAAEPFDLDDTPA